MAWDVMDGLADASTIESTSTNIQLRFEDFYRVILHYTSWAPDDEPELAKKIVQAVPILNFSSALRVTVAASKHGRSIVTTVPKELAHRYQIRLEHYGFQVSTEVA